MRHAFPTSSECLGVIDEREAEIQAWEHVARDARDGDVGGPLSGVPVGVKDIFDTADMPTTYGSPIYRGHRPTEDADVVRRLRAAGATVLGKTVTTEFATWPPSRTRNPVDPRRTPGGSSSGSAAAVAAGMVPLALGTQTVGSTIRPASFCGVAGYKPTRGRVPLDGAKPQSPSQDTIGLLARSVRELDALAGPLGLTTRAVAPPSRPPQLACVRTPWWGAADEDGASAFARAVASARAAGAEVTPVELPGVFAPLLDAQGVLTAVEVAQSLDREYRLHRDLLSPQLVRFIEAGRSHITTELEDARALAARCSTALEPVLSRVDALLTPAACGEAPLGLEFTGDATFARAWSMLGTPAISVPGLSGSSGMPIGTQLVGSWDDDQGLLDAAAWLEDALA